VSATSCLRWSCSEFRDAGPRTVERFDDRAIARLVFEAGQELEELEASLGAARDDLWDPQGGPDVEAQCPQLEAGGEERFDRREGAPARGGRAAQARREIREISEANRSEAARAEEDPQASVLALVGDARVGRSIAQPQVDDAVVGGVGVREGRRRERAGVAARAQAPAAGSWSRGRWSFWSPGVVSSSPSLLRSLLSSRG
jgi:hypothetical protein